jgi:prolipoprotein diacylglyceryltransferase
MLEAVFRFVIEFVRYYEPAMWASAIGVRLTFNQLIAAALFALGAAFVWLSTRRAALLVDASPSRDERPLKSP